MKKVKTITWKIIFHLGLGISKIFRLSYSIGSNSITQKYSFFNDFGPKILIVRNNQIICLGSAFELECKLDMEGKILDCRLRFMDTEKGDLVFYGHRNAYCNYEKYHALENN